MCRLLCPLIVVFSFADPRQPPAAHVHEKSTQRHGDHAQGLGQLARRSPLENPKGSPGRRVDRSRVRLPGRAEEDLRHRTEPVSAGALAKRHHSDAARLAERQQQRQGLILHGDLLVVGTGRQRANATEATGGH